MTNVTLSEFVKRIHDSTDMAKVEKVLKEFEDKMESEKFTMADTVTLLAAMIGGFAEGSSHDTETPIQKQLAFKGHVLNVLGMIATTMAVELLEASMVDPSKSN